MTLKILFQVLSYSDAEMTKDKKDLNIILSFEHSATGDKFEEALGALDHYMTRHYPNRFYFCITGIYI